MAKTKNILTSLHGKRVGLSSDKKLVVEGGTAIVVDDAGVANVPSGTPGTLNATGTLTAALMRSGIVTSSTAAAVVATVDTGTAMDTALASTHPGDGLQLNEGFVWHAINTGANAFTVTAATAHTLVGSGVVAAGTSGKFFTKRTAANTYVTYRLS